MRRVATKIWEETTEDVFPVCFDEQKRSESTNKKYGGGSFDCDRRARTSRYQLVQNVDKLARSTDFMSLMTRKIIANLSFLGHSWCLLRCTLTEVLKKSISKS